MTSEVKGDVTTNRKQATLAAIAQADARQEKHSSYSIYAKG